MNVFQALFLGLIQGIAEFLPISSSGHLAVFQNFLGLTSAEDSSLLFDALLHLGTLISIFVVFWDDIKNIVFECVDLVKSSGHPVPGEKKTYSNARLLLMVVFATLPLIVFLPFQKHVDKLFYSTAFIGLAFLGNGAMLFVSDKMQNRGKTERTMKIRDALLVGLCQGIATMPGLSRSGTTITAGIATGLDRQFSLKFSFLISIPAVLGANLLSLIKAFKVGVDWTMLPAYLAGMIVAAVAGYFSLTLLKYISRKGKFGWFAYYCFAAGFITLLLTIIL